VKQKDLDEVNHTDSKASYQISSFFVRCLMVRRRHLQKATPALFYLADLATAYRSESVQAALHDISTTAGNKKRRVDQFH
jgi:hypothetical protein